MEFRLLGPLEVVDGATSLPIAARKQRALLAVLLLNANRTVSRERIVDDLWGEAVPETARKMVQIYVSQLRKALPEPRLHTRSPGYVLELDGDELDLDRFERLVADGRAALAGGRPGDASDLIGRALALWRGPALTEFSEPFAQHEAARLEELRLTALEWRLEADLAVGRDAEVAGELEALVPRYPLRERLRSQQMLALYRAGRQADALASYQSFRRALADELGIDPSPALKDLERRMLVQDPGLERPAAGAVPAGAPPAAVPRASRIELVGREAEVAEIGGFLSAGSPAGFLLVGGPGIGKTSLWEAGVDAAREGGLRVLAARPTDAEAQHSFAALIDLFDGVASSELGGLPSPQLHALEVALLRAAPTGPPPEGPAISVGFLGALRALAARQPLLVAVDDIQWLDRPSADALAYVARRLEGAAVRFLFAARPEGQPALEVALGPDGLARLDVEPLSMGALRRVLAGRLGLDLPRKLVRRIAETTLGNPLFALEVGRTIAESGPIEAGDDLPLPDSVEELLGTRVGRLSEPVRRVVLAVALSSDPRVSQLTAIAGSDALEDAVEAGVLIVDGDRVRPFHPLVAAAAIKRSRARDRRELHTALAETTTDDELRMLHLALATELPDAELAAQVAAAARNASARGRSTADAVVLGEHALRLTPDDAPERIERVLELGRYLELAAERQRVTDLIDPELASLPDGPLRVRAHLLLASGTVADNDEIQAHLEAALAAAGNVARLRAPVLAELAENVAAVRVERIPESEGWALEALRAARRAGPDVERVALYALAWTRSMGGKAIDDLCERFRAVSDDAFFIAQSPERIAGQRLVWRGEIGPAREALTRLMVMADQRGEPSSYALQRLHLCELELRIGGWDEAERLLDEWAELSERELLLWPMYERCRALLAVGRGIPGEAERWASEAINLAERTGNRWDLLEALRARGVAALLSREAARAAASLRTVWERTEREGVRDPGTYPVAPDLVEALVESGELDEARAVAERLAELAGEQDHPWGLAGGRRCAALVRLAEDYDERAAEELRLSAAAYGALGLPYERARALLALGRAQRRAKKWGVARESLTRSAAAFDRLGSPGWADDARSELQRVGARRASPAGELTPAERRVAELAAEGLANKEIAQALVVTVNTVEFHLRNVYAKLGVRSRAQLATRLVAFTGGD